MDSIFPTDVREFDSDDRISFSRLDNKFIAVYDDGTEYEFDADAKRWVPTQEETFEHGAELAGPGSPTEEEVSRKRKNGAGSGSDVSSALFPMLYHVARVCDRLRFLLTETTRS